MLFPGNAATPFARCDRASRVAPIGKQRTTVSQPSSVASFERRSIAHRSRDRDPEGANYRRYLGDASDVGNAAGSFSLNYLNKHWGPKLEAMTYGNLKIDIRPSKSVVPHRETPQAVAAGILQGDLNAVAYFAGRDPVFGIMGDLIAGYDTPFQKQKFFRFGGGVEILQKAWDKHYPGKIHVVGAGPFAKEAFVSTVPIRTVADLKGLKLRTRLRTRRRRPFADAGVFGA
ncbi:MAG: hypothetical protein MJE12_19765 [Alphaproteobacteria bacterium]|nr:hypothetical protein [Alphaproteobacteria bacterium]